jgi:hypothetical protein
MPRAKKTPDVPADRLDGMLARLKLSGIRDQLDSLLDEAARLNLSTLETLTMLLSRQRPGAQKRLSAAHKGPNRHASTHAVALVTSVH